MLNFLRRILTHNFFYVEPVKIFKLVPRTGKSGPKLHMAFKTKQFNPNFKFRNQKKKSIRNLA